MDQHSSSTNTSAAMEIITTPEKASPSAAARNVVDMPVEVVEMALRNLPIRDILSASAVCRSLHTIIERSTRLQGIMQFKGGLESERHWCWSRAEGLFPCGVPTLFDGKRIHFFPKLVNPCFQAWLNRNIIRTCYGRDGRDYETGSSSAYLMPTMARIDENAHFLKMQCTNPPSRKLKIELLDVDHIHPDDEENPRPQKEFIITNEEGITIGDIRQQAPSVFGHDCYISGDDTRTHDLDLFASPQAWEFVESGRGREPITVTEQEKRSNNSIEAGFRKRLIWLRDRP